MYTMVNFPTSRTFTVHKYVSCTIAYEIKCTRNKPLWLEQVNMTQDRDCSALRHLPALYIHVYNKRNYCIHVHVYLFVQVHVCLSIGLTIVHI